jgi:aminoglycoside phosphotransferase family enzyme/predicted kinase
MVRERHPQDTGWADREEEELAAFLSDPASYDEPAERVDTITTHAARVFLAGRRAYKIKKRIKLPFLDFSTLELRREALKRELELNRSHAPDIYIGLSIVSRRPDGTLTFGDGEPVDYVLVMNRFDQAQLMARLAARGPLPARVCRDLADMVARYHRSAPIATGTSGASAMRDTVAGLAAGLTDAAPGHAAPLMAEFARKSLADVVLLGPLLEDRSHAGYVRRCHGDLHLGNIVMHQGKPVPFDALEFDERLARIDVLYDLAFLLMDLEVRGDRAAANAVFNAYVAAAPTGGEVEGLAALPLFLATRAAVRALVALESALQKPEGQDADDVARAVSYATAANAYLSPPRPALIAVGGLSGTGKSTLAASLAPLLGAAPGALILRTDVERKRLFEVRETERLPADRYTERFSDEVYALLYQKTERALAAGHAVIFDGVSAKPAEREIIAAIAGRLGVPFDGLWLEAPLEVQIGRVATRVGDASDSTPDVVRSQAARDLGEVTWHRVDASQSAAYSFEQAKIILGPLLSGS